MLAKLFKKHKHQPPNILETDEYVVRFVFSQATDEAKRLACSRVCKLWRKNIYYYNPAISYQRCLWRKVEMANELKGTCGDIIKSSPKYNPTECCNNSIHSQLIKHVLWNAESKINVYYLHLEIYAILKKENLELLKIMVENQWVTKLDSHDFRTACETRNYDLVKWIIDNIEIEWTDTDILHSFRTTKSILILVLKTRKIIHSLFWTRCAIKYCATHNWYSTLPVLLQYLSRYYPEEFLDPETLTKTCEEGRIDCVPILLAFPRVDPNDFNAALLRACWKGHLEIVKLLVSSGKIDLHHKNNKPLRVAMKYHNEDVVKYLLEHGNS